MYFESCGEHSVYSPYVFIEALLAFQSVYAAQGVFVVCRLRLHHFSYCDFGIEGHAYVCVFEQFSVGVSLFPSVYE